MNYAIRLAVPITSIFSAVMFVVCTWHHNVAGMIGFGLLNCLLAGWVKQVKERATRG